MSRVRSQVRGRLRFRVKVVRLRVRMLGSRFCQRFRGVIAIIPGSGLGISDKLWCDDLCKGWNNKRLGLGSCQGQGQCLVGARILGHSQG